jgi:hypothetical protein
MVLHHVAQRAGRVVVAGAALHAERLGHGDLHVVDMRGVPQRLEQGVGEAQRHQVLHRLLAEIMVDAVDAVFREHRADRVVHGIFMADSRLLADRLFHHHARIFDRFRGAPGMIA